MKHSDGGWGHMLTVICFPPSCAPSHHLCFKDGAQTTLTLIRKEQWLKTRQRSWNNTSKLRDIFPATLLIISPLLIPNSVKKKSVRGVLLQVAEVYLRFGAHGARAGAHSPPWGIRYPPWPRPLPFVMVNEWSAWLHFLIPFPPRLRWGPTTHCTLSFL